MNSVVSSMKLVAVEIPEQHSPGGSSMTFHLWTSSDPSVGTRAFANWCRILSKNISKTIICIAPNMKTGMFGFLCKKYCRS